MNEIKIQIPDNCELIKDGDTYVVKEKKQVPPRSWEEFCKRCPKKESEGYISSTSEICVYDLPSIRDEKIDKNVCSSKEETEAFLALMQLRQLRKAWVGDWKQTKGNRVAGIFYSIHETKITTFSGILWSNAVLSFPSIDMAEDFLNCFRDLCETAKILL